MNKMATVLRENLHLLSDPTGNDASPADTPAAAEKSARVDARDSERPEGVDIRNPLSSGPPPALTWSVRHFGLAALVGGAFVSGLLRLVRGSRGQLR